MAQVGLHGLMSLVAGEYLLSRYVHSSAPRRALLFGFAMGNLIPDLDFLAVVGLYPVNHSLALHLHRGFSHSLLAALALWVGLYGVAALMKDAYVRFLGHGMAAGVAMHFVVDLFLWFAPVDVFWPASAYGLIPPVNLWSWYTTPVLVGRIMGAAELAAYALYYDYLARLAVAFETNRDMVAPVQRLSTVCWVVWAGLTALSFDLDQARFEIYLYIPMGIVFLPACFYITWRMQATIEMLSIFRKPLQ